MSKLNFDLLFKQDYPYTPPLRSRYATRSSKAVVAPQLLPLPPHAVATSNLNLRAPLRILKEDRVIATAKPDSPGCSSLPNAHGPVRESSVDDVKPSTPSELIVGHFTEHAISVNESQLPKEKNSEVQRHEKEKCNTVEAPRSSRCLSQTRSLNLTEYAKALQENSDEDEEEVNSDPNHYYVHGHRVKKEIAGFVRSIFDKYGDPTKESDVMNSTHIISFFFERMHEVYQKLEQKKFFDVTSAEINGMINDLQFFQKNKLEVGWLLEKLEHIAETKRSILKYVEITGEVEKFIESNKKIDKELEQSQMHMALIQRKVAAAEAEKLANLAKVNELKEMKLHIRAKVHGMANQPLVHGLL